MKTKILVLLFLTISSTLSSQNTEVNNYKYVVIPSTYDFFEEENKYQLNALTKFLFNKYGYTAFLDSEDYPKDLNLDRCLALYADVDELKGGLFKTKIKIDLKDCKGKVVHSSKVGETREKDYATAYNLALRDAFETYKHYNYEYKPQTTETVKKDLKQASNEIMAVNVSNENKVVKPETTVDVVPTKPSTPKVSPAKSTLYAQPISNGFQVVDTTPKVVMVLLETGKQNVFIVKDDNAIVYKEDGFWYYSKNDGKNSSLESLDIKF